MALPREKPVRDWTSGDCSKSLGIGVTDENLILPVEMMIQPPRSLISARVVGNHAAGVLKLVYEEGAKRICSRIERQCATEYRRKSRMWKTRCRICRLQHHFAFYCCTHYDALV